MISSKFKTALGKILGKDSIHTSSSMKEMYAYDSSPFISRPDMVVFPSSAKEISKILKLAAREGVSILPRGAGTCLSGGAVPVKAGISLVMTRMNKILDIDSFSRTALVEPGVVNLDLQKALDSHNLIFPPDPASQKVATIGGNVAECAGGIQGARYGVTKNYVLGLELVLSDGTITTTGLLSKEETLGPDTTGIFNGSEGSLAIITKILVSCRPEPESLRTALASFNSLNDAASAVSSIIKKGIIPTALELMDQTMLKAVDDFIGIGFPKEAKAVLLLEVDGYEIDLDRQLALMVDICKNHGARDVKQAANAAERELLWKARRSGNGAIGSIRPAYIVHDVTVPRNQVAKLLTRIQEIGKDFDIIIAQMAHAGDGNAHPHLLYYPHEKNIQQRLHDATKEIFKAALELGGTISGEHGIGLEKKAFMGMQFSSIDLDYMKKIKQIMDPGNLLNPGKIFPTKEEIHESGQVFCTEKNHPEIPDDDSGQIIEFIPDNLTIKVKGSTPLWKVQETASSINAFLPLSLGTKGDVTMQSLVENGIRGIDDFGFGSLKEYIYGVEFTSSSGKLISNGGHTAKNVAGYDFTRLLWKSKKSLGTLKSITLKLLPCPEKKQLIIQNFSNLSDCIKTAKTILNTDICLCTLMANGEVIKGKNRWQLIVGLTGSSLLVEKHTEILSAILNKNREDFAIIDHKDSEVFWKTCSKAGDSYPGPLLYGEGSRNGMFAFIDQKEKIFNTLESVRIRLDFGCPALEIHAACHQAPMAFEVAAFDMADDHFPGFYLKRTHSPGTGPAHASIVYTSLFQNRLASVPCPN